MILRFFSAMPKISIVSNLAIISMSLASTAHTQTHGATLDSFTTQSIKKGTLIAEAAYTSTRGFDTFSYKIEMTNKNKKGQTSKRNLDVSIRESQTGTKSRLLVTAPKSLSGISVLSISHNVADKDSDQWIYLARQRKTRRLVTGQRNRSFLGSELNFEDIIPQEINQFKFAWIKDEDCPGEGQCQVLYKRASDNDREYAYQHIWINSDRLTTEKVVYYNAANTAYKSLNNSDFSLQNSKFWQPAQSKVINLMNGRSTHLVKTSFEYARDGEKKIPDSEFSSSGFYK